VSVQNGPTAWPPVFPLSAFLRTARPPNNVPLSTSDLHCVLNMFIHTRHSLGCRVVELVLPRAREAALDAAVAPQAPHDPGQLLRQSGLLLGLRTQHKHLARVLLEGAQTQQPLGEEEEEEVFCVCEKKMDCGRKAVHF